MQDQRRGRKVDFGLGLRGLYLGYWPPLLGACDYTVCYNRSMWQRGCLPSGMAKKYRRAMGGGQGSNMPIKIHLQQSRLHPPENNLTD